MADSKKPQPEATVEFDQVEGHELIVHPRSLMPSQAVRLLAAAGIDRGDDVTLEAIQRMMEEIEESFLLDAEGYTALYREKGLAAIMDLVGAFLGELLGGEI